MTRLRREAFVGTVKEGDVFTEASWGSAVDAEFQGCTFIGVDLSEARVDSTRFVECHFERCDLSLWKPLESVVGGCRFDDCRMLGIDWTMAKWPRVPLHAPNAFARCDLSMGTFADLDLGSVRFEECRLRDVSYRGARLSGAFFGGSDCRGADFSGADLTAASLAGATGLSVDPRTTKLEGATVDAGTGVAILEALGIILEEAAGDVPPR